MYVANQVTVEGMTREEIEGSKAYSNKCLTHTVATWERKEYIANVIHYNMMLKTIEANYNDLKSRGVDAKY
tara:strand:+ start:910 stop:1122 length:213 start_codon:yes stop_codon:yes gene_type:complete